jgi:hypothetical protein
MGTMAVLSGAGDSKITWSARRPDEVAAARAHFRELRGKRYLAFKTEGREGRKGSQIDEFDPELENILMVPPSVGG